MAILLYASHAAAVAFVNSLPVTEDIEGGSGPVALAAASDSPYTFVAPITPNIVSRAVSQDGREAQSYPFSDIDEAAIQAWVDSLVGDGTLNASDVTIISGGAATLPSDWQYPATP